MLERVRRVVGFAIERIRSPRSVTWDALALVELVSSPEPTLLSAARPRRVGIEAWRSATTLRPDASRLNPRERIGKLLWISHRDFVTIEFLCEDLAKHLTDPAGGALIANLRQIAKFAKVPIAVLSGLPRTVPDADFVLLKPLEAEELVATVMRLCEAGRPPTSAPDAVARASHSPDGNQ